MSIEAEPVKRLTFKDLLMAESTSQKAREALVLVQRHSNATHEEIAASFQQKGELDFLNFFACGNAYAQPWIEKWEPENLDKYRKGWTKTAAAAEAVQKPEPFDATRWGDNAQARKPAAQQQTAPEIQEPDDEPEHSDDPDDYRMGDVEPDKMPEPPADLWQGMPLAAYDDEAGRNTQESDDDYEPDNLGGSVANQQAQQQEAPAQNVQTAAADVEDEEESEDELNEFEQGRAPSALPGGDGKYDFTEPEIESYPIPESNTVYQFLSESPDFYALLRRPPDFLGSIIAASARTSHRFVFEAHALNALWMIGTCGAIGKRKALGVGKSGRIKARGKTAMMTITMAESGSGKEAPQDFTKEVMNSMGYLRHIKNKPRSDKSIIDGVIAGNGAVGYLIDEAHALLESAKSFNSSEHKKAIPDLITELYTANRLMLSDLHSRNLAKDAESLALEAERKNTEIEKKIADGISPNTAFMVKQRQRIQEMRTRAERWADWAENGIPQPCACFNMFSTPIKMDKYLNTADTEAGLLPRILVLRAGNRRPGREDTEEFNVFDPYFRELQNKLADIANSDRTQNPWVVEPDALKVFMDIWEYFDHPDILNAPETGAINTRAVEITTRLASLMALDTGVVTYDIARYALIMFLASRETIVSTSRRNNVKGISQKVQLFILDKVKGKTKVSVLRRAVEAYGDYQNAVAEAKLKGRDFFAETLEALIKRGVLEYTGSRKGSVQKAKPTTE
ncbi:hypothetical protein KYT24_004359 [Salmonella enterica]|nr:hypothetical protein [Salmonella enterica]